MQIAGTGVVTQTRPMAKHVRARCQGQGLEIGEAIHKAHKIRDDRGNLGLLEHNFGHPDPIRGRIGLPRQGFAPFLVKPA